MVTYGVGTHWKFNCLIKGKWEFYTGKILEEDDYSLLIETIKSEMKTIHKDSIKDSKRFEK